MKKVLAGSFLLLAILSACGNTNEEAATRGNNTNQVEKVIAGQIAAADVESGIQEQTEVKEQSQVKEQTEAVITAESFAEGQNDMIAETGVADSDFDYDLTVMNSDMVYSTIYQFMYYPENYIGKTVRMRGQFVPYEDEDTGNVYYCCYISDAAACCQQGMEFVCKDDRLADPENWPEDFAEIEISGVYETYYEDDLLYCHLNNAEMIELN